VGFLLVGGGGETGTGKRKWRWKLKEGGIRAGEEGIYNNTEKESEGGRYTCYSCNTVHRRF